MTWKCIKCQQNHIGNKGFWHGIPWHPFKKLGKIWYQRNLILNYLRDREKFVEINGVQSRIEKINTGVAQETILGPLLISVNIYSLLSIFSYQIIISNTDGTVILCSGETWEQVIALMNLDIKRVNTWFYDNKLTINIDKFVYMEIYINLNEKVVFLLLP